MRILALLMSFLVAHVSHADATLSFKSYLKDNSDQLTYYIKDGMLRFVDGDSQRINLYNKRLQSFISIDQQSGTISRIDKDIITKRVEHLNAKRLQKLKTVEEELAKKLATMSDKEKEIAESLVNQLKYPEFYGSHTLVKTKASNQTKKINNIECQIYEIKRETALIRRVCMADAKALGLTADDYDTLRDFYHFNYHSQTQLMLAMGKTDFSQIDYQEENMPGIAISVNNIGENPEQPDLLLNRLSLAPLEATLFSDQTMKKSTTLEQMPNENQ